MAVPEEVMGETVIVGGAVVGGVSVAGGILPGAVDDGSGAAVVLS